MLQKEWFLKIFGQDGQIIKTIPWVNIRTYPRFNAQMNGGYGECSIDLVGEDYKYDDFDEGNLVDFMNIAKLYEVDADNPTGRLVYQGFASSYEPYLDGGSEGVRMTFLGFGSLITASYYGTSPGYIVTHTNEDPEAIAKAIADSFNAAFGGSLISYSGTTNAVGTNVTKTFTERTWFEALNDTKDLAPGFWWMIREDGKLHFKPKPATPTHTFTFKKDIIRFSGLKTMEKVKNEIIVERNGGTRTSYTDAASQAKFGFGSPPTGKWTTIIRDSGIPDLDTANQRGNQEKSAKKDEKLRATVTISSEYDIESIKPGDTCCFRNFKLGSTFFGSNNIQITSLTYNGDTADLVLEEEATGFGRILQDFVAS